ncbi:MAG: LamG domain-containing protein [Deltaproteobacteria bacterium]|nr:LamG domain-containing protein [Deltaproteobacteria bacterium]
MRILALCLVAACGRVGFDSSARGDGSTGDGAHDGVTGDVAGDALPSDLIGYWPLDGTIHDVVSGTTSPCTAPQCPIAQVAGHISAAMRFDGVDDCVYLAATAAMQPPQFTIAIWANEDSPLGMRECQVSKRADNGGGMPMNSWQLETTATPAQEAFTSYHGGAGNDQITSGASAIQGQTWQHIVATYDGLNERFYVDGVRQNSVGNSSPVYFDGHDIALGCDDNNGNSEHYQGMLDELRIYNRALSQAEVQALP